ncbi:GNAT family N-acetyltransferase [Bacillus sp. JJ722]|uniref:GNAT family N-acetyltransferase n=1 Tax=Bacillus sp. JJ722 TaxID=3122973 RepID=UPI002FFED8AB
MREGIAIHECSPKYTDQIIDLILHIQQEEFNVSISKEDQPDLLIINDFYQKGLGNFWVCTYQEEIVGTIGLIDIGNRQVALRKMFVKQEFRGKEFLVAQTLLNTAIKWSKENGVNQIFLGTIDVFKAAQKFYEKNGFTKVIQSELPERFPLVKVDTLFYKLDTKEAQV